MELQAQHDSDLETLKASLKKTQFSQFNEKRFETIETLYRLLVRHSIGLNKLLSRLKDAKARGEILKDITFTELCIGKYRLDLDEETDISTTWDNAWTYFCENRLYLREELAIKIEKPLYMGFFALMPAIAATSFEKISELIPVDLYKSFEILRDLDPLDVTKDAMKEFTIILEELEREFRSIPA